jgi:hypothetical protein
MITQDLTDNLKIIIEDAKCKKLLKKLKMVVKPYFVIYSHLKQGLYMTFEDLATFCKVFGLFPDIVTRPSLLLVYQSFLLNNYDEKTFELNSLINLLGVVALQYDSHEPYTPAQRVLILIEKMSVWQSKIDKAVNQQMKSQAYFSGGGLQRPKDFITVFGKDVMELFPHVMPKTATTVNVKPKIVIQRV